MKARLSTKMVGETLEQHCETEFNRIRATAFPKAYFEKDNDARAGSKGDYIFRDSDDAGTEIVSIMFEMKNESDRTATKNKNEDFLKELDKDRSEKGCEYAVLVSLLEPESELYNTGILSKIPALAFLIAAHVVIVLPVIARPVIAALEQMDAELETASMSLGASPATTVRKVTVPVILPTVVVGSIFGLARSITDFAITLFLVPVGFVPMSIEIYNSTNYSIPQLTSANAVILLAMSLLVVGIGEAAARRVSRG